MQDIEQIINSEKPVLVDFFATWCEPCKWVEPVLDELIKHSGERLTIIKIDIDEYPEIARKHLIMSVPTLILFKQGEIKWRMAGFKYATALWEILEPLI